MTAFETPPSDIDEKPWVETVELHQNPDGSTSAYLSMPPSAEVCRAMGERIRYELARREVNRKLSQVAARISLDNETLAL